MLNREELVRLRDRAIADSALLRQQSRALVESAFDVLSKVTSADLEIRCRIVEMRIELENRAAQLD